MKKTLLTLMLAFTTPMTMAAMDHSAMSHSAMDHNGMDHSQMDTTKMDHQMMNMKSMSDVGMPALGSKPDKVVYVTLTDDMTITLKKAADIQPNDVVQFVVINTGKMTHEFAIGSPQEQAQSRQIGKGHHTENGNAIMVAPGKAKQVLWHFHGSNKIEFACNMEGHAAAGMTQTITL